jgi:hypothetical protein
MESESPRKRKYNEDVTASPLGMLVDAEAARSFQLNDVGLSARGTQAGNIYSGLNIGGQTRAILGNVFYTTHNNVTTPSEQTAEEKRQEKLMETLAFGRMDFRRATVDPAHTRTCRWIFEEDAFSRWCDPKFREGNHGFLWIKGKPGSGKSTLMKCILDYMTRNESECKIVSFFFNARGNSLERSTEGCYRSILHQMLQQIPRLRTSIQIPYALKEEESLPIEMLHNIFHDAVLSLQQERLILIIDALDECDQKEVRTMVQFLETLSQSAKLQGITLRMCFASRHYPSITVRFCESLVVEYSKNHRQDMLRYARDTLNIQSEVQREELLYKLMRKSEGVFLWVVLVVRMLNEQFDRGQSRGQLLAAITSLPDALDALLCTIISGGAADPYLLPTLVWVLSGSLDMSYEELFDGIKLGAGETSHLQDIQSIDLPAMKRFIVHASKGLIELAPGNEADDVSTSNACGFHFIHESVRQHILAGGLALLSPRLASNVGAACQALMAEWCEICLWHFQDSSPLPADVPILRAINNITLKQFRIDYVKTKGKEYQALEEPAVLCYARRCTYQHLSIAYDFNMYDSKRMLEFPLRGYEELSVFFGSVRRDNRRELDIPEVP